jgi:hypothetical protein
MADPHAPSAPFAVAADLDIQLLFSVALGRV